MNFDGNIQTIADYEHYCRQATAPAMYEYLYGEVGDEDWSTHTSNRRSIERLRLRPRVLVNVADRSLATSLLGAEMSLPVAVGPTGIIRDLDPAAELGTARAAGRAGTLFVLSSISSLPAVQVAAATTGPWWQQTFIYKDWGLTEWQIANAIELGAGAIVVTVSNAGGAWHHQTVRFPGSRVGTQAEPASNLVGYDRDPLPTFLEMNDAIDSGGSWSDIERIRATTELPLVIKGIQTAEDAQLCYEHGVDGIVVSNHGGRFLQGARGTMEALPEIVEAVDGRVEVSVDGGFRSGEDILKALALGARTVWIGRAARWAQAAAGEDGVVNVLEILRRELDEAMGLSGIRNAMAVPSELIGQPTPSADSAHG